MKKPLLIIFLLLLSCFCAVAQEDDLRQIVRAVFYHEDVFNKIFFEYKGSQITFMEGYRQGMKGAFLLPDTTLQKRIPNLLHLVGTSHGTEKYFMTITLLSNPNGNTYITSNIMDPAILVYIDIDRILISGKNAILQFHTTSFPDSSAAKGNHFTFDCSLIKRKKGWRIKSLAFEPIECCTPLW